MLNGIITVSYYSMSICPVIMVAILCNYKSVWDVILSKCNELNCSNFIIGGDLNTSLHRDYSLLQNI